MRRLLLALMVVCSALSAESKLAGSIKKASTLEAESELVSARINKAKTREIALTARAKLSVSKVNFMTSKAKEIKAIQ